MLTYGDIYKQFIADTGMSESLIDDYRPCVKTYDVPTISDAIVVWLKNGSKIIYIYGSFLRENYKSYYGEKTNVKGE